MGWRKGANRLVDGKLAENLEAVPTSEGWNAHCYVDYGLSVLRRRLNNCSIAAGTSPSFLSKRKQNIFSFLIPPGLTLAPTDDEDYIQ